MRPTVSVGMPVFNGRTFLAEAIESILNQTFGDLELIISDNGSTDDTESIARDYARIDRRVRLVHHRTNRGAAWNYNYVFRISRGRLFKWAAADDLCDPPFLARCVEALDADPGAALAYPKTRIIDAAGAAVGDYEDNLDLRADQPERRFVSLMRRLGECNAVFGLVRSDVLRRTRLLGSFISSDGCLLAELSLYGRMIEIPERLFSRRVHAAASSCDRSTNGQMSFYDPHLRGPFFPTWRQLGANLRSVARSPLGAGVRLRLAGGLLRTMVQARHVYAAELGDAGRAVAARLVGRRKGD